MFYSLNTTDIFSKYYFSQCEKFLQCENNLKVVPTSCDFINILRILVTVTSLTWVKAFLFLYYLMLYLFPQSFIKIGRFKTKLHIHSYIIGTCKYENVHFRKIRNIFLFVLFFMMLVAVLNTYINDTILN